MWRVKSSFHNNRLMGCAGSAQPTPCKQAAARVHGVRVRNPCHLVGYKRLKQSDFNMGEFNEKDVALQHERLADHSGYLRLIHRPSGLFVEAHLTSRPVLRIKHDLMCELREKVLAHDVEQGRD